MESTCPMPHKPHVSIVVNTDALMDGLRKAQASLDAFLMGAHMSELARALRTFSEYGASLEEVKRLTGEGKRP